jgi:hypothetical protein
MRHASLLICLVALSAAGETALAQTAVPNVFTSGTPARAAEVNENFAALAAAIDSLAARLGKLEGGAVVDADVVGTYTLSILQVGIGRVASGIGDVEAISYDGTFTFAADGTFTSTFTGKKNSSSGPQPDDGTITGTWSRTGNNVTIVIAEEGPTTVALHCASGCRVIVGALASSADFVGDDSSNNLFVLSRVN